MKTKYALSIIVSCSMVLVGISTNVSAATINVPHDYATIQGAIDAASDGDVISIASGTHTEAERIEVSKSVTIQGQGENNTIVQAHAEPGQADDVVFHVTGTGVTMKDMTIQHGAGGVRNGGTLTLTRCTVSNNQVDVDAGGISNYEGTMALTNCTISNNEGGMGAIRNGRSDDSEESTMTLTNCTISNNEGGQEGSVQNLGMMSLTNCTISSNHGGMGSCNNGDIGGEVKGATLILTNCTVTNNESGMLNWEGTVNIKNTIIAGNGFDVGEGTITSLDYNLIENIRHSTIEGIATHNIYGVDPMLLPLADNGGFTQTCALQEGSPAINAGTDDGAPATDQRGYARVGAPDIGAYESGGVTSAGAATWGQIKAQF